MSNNNIVPPHLVIQAMRDSGYKNAAYALAELMDNAIEAGATDVELLCVEREELVKQRYRSRIEQVAVLDNGHGMDEKVLRMALQFGNGTHLQTEQQTGIGRFGMGLPNSSISQCTRVEVWSWQEGRENAIYSYIDVNEIKNGQQQDVPEPIPQPVPQKWKQVGNTFGDSGTLVVWSNLDRCMWRTSQAIIDNSEFVIGRMYRKFLDSRSVSIRLAAFNVNDLATPTVDKYALPNDPGYLIEKTSCPDPFNNVAMFQPWGEEYEITPVINFDGKDYEVKIRFSYAKEEARPGSGAQPGSLPHGQHAKKNVGISIVRSGRELELDQAWVSQYDPVERWWGVEVEFPPALDELFGVTNNKQGARNFSELAKLNIEELLKGGKTPTQVREELEDDEDPRAPLIEVAHRIDTNIKSIRRLLQQQTRGSRTRPSRYGNMPTPEETGTLVTRELQKEEGKKGESDEDETLPSEERQNAITQTLVDEGVPELQAKGLAATTISDGLKYVFATADLETRAFFSVKPRGGAIVILLNTNHPAYTHLVEVLELDVENTDEETLKIRLTRALYGLKLLLEAWARYEDEQPDGDLREHAQNVRVDWGKIARRFLKGEE